MKYLIRIMLIGVLASCGDASSDSVINQSPNTKKDKRASDTLDGEQNVYIPDANFKAYLVANHGINTNNDTEIQVSEASSYNGAIKFTSSYIYISDLTGLETFTALTELFCGDGQLTSLDVSQNTALITLYCGDNQLTNLDVSQNTALTRLRCDGNQLTSLDVSQNTALTKLYCVGNQLTSLDVSQNTALTELSCWNNQLTSLDISQNTALTELYCGDNRLTSLDVSQNNALTTLSCDGNLFECVVGCKEKCELIDSKRCN